LAPETPFPGALDDAVAAYQAITSQGVLPSRVIIAGDSAGGGLSVATALALKAKGLPQPAGVFVMSPWSDLSQRGESYRAKAESDLIVTKPALDRWASAYLANRDADNPLASPVHGELDGLAPLLIQVGSEEVLLSDSTKLAERAGLAGVDVRLQIAPGMPHVWHYLWPALSSARAAIGAAGGWMKARVR
jgi:acetyl esterase/lipase